MKKIPLLSLCFLLSLGVYLSIRYAKSPPSLPKTTVAVNVALVKQQTITRQITSMGTLASYATVAVNSQVNGPILAIYFKPGLVLKAGDPLVKIDPRPYQIALQQAQATFAQAQAQLANTQLRLNRYQKLLKPGYIAKDVYDQLRSTYDSQAAIVAAAKAAVANAELQLSYTLITAPISGQAGDILVDKGNVITANSTKPLVIINQVDPIVVSFALPEQYLPQIRQQPPTVIATLADNHQLKVQGKLSFINNQIDSSTGTIMLKAEFANSQQLLWPGQFVKLQLNLNTLAQAITIPDQAIQQGQKGPYVFVVDKQDIAHYRLITPSFSQQGLTVISQGLLPGETVVLDGQLQLQEGSIVKPTLLTNRT